MFVKIGVGGKMTPGSWNEWQNHVLAELKRLSNAVEKHAEDDNRMHSVYTKELERLKTTAQIYGAIAGAVVAFVPAIVAYFLK